MVWLLTVVLGDAGAQPGLGLLPRISFPTFQENSQQGKAFLVTRPRGTWTTPQTVRGLTGD